MDGWIDVGISFIFGLWTYLEVGGSCFVYHILTFLIHLFICVRVYCLDDGVHAVGLPVLVES